MTRALCTDFRIETIASDVIPEDTIAPVLEIGPDRQSLSIVIFDHYERPALLDCSDRANEHVVVEALRVDLDDRWLEIQVIQPNDLSVSRLNAARSRNRFAKAAGHCRASV